MPTTVESETILEMIQVAATEPSKVSGDAGSYEQVPLTQLIEAHKYLSGTDSDVVNSPQRGIRFSKMRPPGAV